MPDYEFRSRARLPLQTDAADIEAFLLAKDPTASRRWDDMGKAEHARAFTAAGTAGTDIVDDLYFGLVDTISDRGTEEDFAKRVTPILKAKGWLEGDDGRIAHRVALIYDTNLRIARANGRWSRFQASKSALPYVEAFTAEDDRVRHPPHSESDHTAFDGIVLPVDHPFVAEYWTPLGFRCFLPETRIEGAIKAGVRRWHNGKAVKLRMASGRELSVTPDHAILTGRGWLLAEHVRKGDHCLSSGGIVDRPSVGGIDNRNTPPRADDLFETIHANALAGGQGAALQLHDKTRGGQGVVDVVFADAKLANEALSELFGEDVLVRATARAGDPMLADGSVRFGVWEANSGYARQPSHVRLADPERLGNSAHGSLGINGQLAEAGLDHCISITADLPSASALPFHATRRLFDGLPLDLFRLGSSAQDDALFDELARDGRAVDAGLFRELKNAHAAKVFSDEVVEVEVFDYSGHVYDFQSEEGVVLANSVLTHNCRCGWRQVSRSQFARRGLAITSDAELEDRKARIGPPVFKIIAPLERQLDAMVAATNADLMPGMPPVNPDTTRRAGEAEWASVVAARSFEVLSEALAKLFGMA